MTKTGYKILSGCLCAALICTITGASVHAENGALHAPQDTKAASAAAEERASKEETVYVIAGADGKQQSVIVSDWLKNPNKETSLQDVSDLTDIENVKGDETWTANGTSLTWDAQGNDIYYQGKSETELPVTMNISYQLDGKDIAPYTEKQMRKLRGSLFSMLFQDPMTSLDPTMTIGKQIMEGMLWHFKMPKAEAYKKALELLEEVGITDAEKRMKNYPHQLSGGMRQRVVIAIALSCDPDLLICDEPTTALDVTIQAKILELIRSIQKERGISVIYITHDLGVVAKVADYVDVMYAGKIVETGTIDEIFYDPKHPYTWGLLSAMPDLDTADDRLYTIPGSPPNLLHEKQGDAFAPRNHFALNIDDEVDPPMFKISDTHYAATWLLDPRAPKVDMPPELAQRIARMRAEAEKIKEAE